MCKMLCVCEEKSYNSLTDKTLQFLPIFSKEQNDQSMAFWSRIYQNTTSWFTVMVYTYLLLYYYQSTLAKCIHSFQFSLCLLPPYFPNILYCSLIQYVQLSIEMSCKCTLLFQKGMLYIWFTSTLIKHYQRLFVWTQFSTENIKEQHSTNEFYSVNSWDLSTQHICLLRLPLIYSCMHVFIRTWRLPLLFSLHNGEQIETIL